ncbi:MAG: hypothetical protein LBI53_05865 [Candidatus Peribacteria bacterium]|jgi:mRNA-degrading endonuclease RelE of RelBE toxin-antitoxin system|nr:hypothetical protein [Candidatus Peribacteria bacterium]
MDKVAKFLATCSAKQKTVLLMVIAKIGALDFSDLDITKMEGKTNEYRCRVGKIRIRFFYDRKKVLILKIGYR